jgi:hypothetical protein
VPAEAVRDEVVEPDVLVAHEPVLRELRQQVTFALFAACDQLEQVTPLVEALFSTLAKGERLG